jgi:hypothetical protein
MKDYIPKDNFGYSNGTVKPEALPIFSLESSYANFSRYTSATFVF